MKLFRLATALLIIGFQPEPVRSDMGLPAPEPAPAVSPNGDLIARIKSTNDPTSRVAVTEVSFHQFDQSKDMYIRRSSFTTSIHPTALFVSDNGEVMMINVSGKQAMTLFSKDGKVTKTWDLEDFLTDAEIKACAQTGSTLQWFDDGGFSGGEFQLKGPSKVIRGLSTPFTVMRGYNPRIRFAATIDIKTGELTRPKRR